MPDKVGDETSLRYKDAVKKEILEVGEGTEKPQAPSIVTVIYKGYFVKSKEVFDSSDGKPVKIELGNPTMVEGFTIGVESMKKKEKALITIKSEHAFKHDKPELKIPASFEKNREALRKKRVAYEVKLIDFIPRVDIDKDKMLIKTIENSGKGGKTPKEIDDVKITVELKQNNITIIKRENWVVAMDSEELGFCMRKMIFTMKRHEKSYVMCKKEFMIKHDKEYYTKIGVDINQDLQVYMQLHHFLRVEDYYNDGSTLRKKLRRGGNGTNPYIESTIECIN